MSKVKTNVMRILDKERINYNTYSYDASDGAIDGIAVAKKIGVPQHKVYKTLVTRGNSKEFYVFVIPVDKELSLKAAAKAVGEKSIEMIKVDEILKVTAYIRGGCSPIGMKKLYKTVIQEEAKNLETIVVSAGKIGFQVELEPKDLIELIGASYEDITA